MDDPIFMCIRGKRGSALRLNREPDSEAWAVFERMGYERAIVAKRYRHTVRCPVNGDGYFYTRRYVVDADQNVVGTVEDPSGPRGEI